VNILSFFFPLSFFFLHTINTCTFFFTLFFFSSYRTHVVDRLTRPIQPNTTSMYEDPMKSFDNNSFGDRQIMNVSTFLSSLQNSTINNFQTPNERKRSSSAPRERTTSKELNSVEKERRQQKFKEFLNRQMHTAEKKTQHMKEVY